MGIYRDEFGTTITHDSVDMHGEITVVSGRGTPDKTFPTVGQLNAAEDWLKHNGFVVLPDNWMVDAVRRDLAARLAPRPVTLKMQTALDGWLNGGPAHAVLLLGEA